MTKRRLAVTRRSAAFSSPRCTRRAKRRSSAGSLISGSFWMSCRYWSKAPEGLARKNAFALPPFDRAIARAPTVDGDQVGRAANGAQYRNHIATVQITAVFHITNLRRTNGCAIYPLSTQPVDKLALRARSW